MNQNIFHKRQLDKLDTYPGITQKHPSREEYFIFLISPGLVTAQDENGDMAITDMGIKFLDYIYTNYPDFHFKQL